MPTGRKTTLLRAHILKQIEKGRCGQLYVSLYGDPSSETNAAITQRAQLIVARRNVRYPLEVHFYDAASANVWGAAATVE